MRRSVQEAIRQVRASITSSKRYSERVSPAWACAETLADEVERLHKRLEDAESNSAAQARRFVQTLGTVETVTSASMSRTRYDKSSPRACNPTVHLVL